MALATLVGRCWKNLSATINGFRPVPEQQTILLGARDFDSAEKSLLDHSAVTQISPRAVREKSVAEALRPALATLRSLTSGIYLHLDLDVLDPSQARANQFAVADGLTLSELLDVVHLVREHFLLAAVAITAYDPTYDEGDRALDAALETRSCPARTALILASSIRKPLVAMSGNVTGILQIRAQLLLYLSQNHSPLASQARPERQRAVELIDLGLCHGRNQNEVRYANQ